MQFKSRKNFVSSKGKHYSSNQVIGLAEYESLLILERGNFKVIGGTISEINRLNQQNKQKKDDILHPFSSDAIWSSPSSTSDSNDFGGFDGGDSGGGGASGDW